MTFPLNKGVALLVKIDWDNNGGFVNANSDISARVNEVVINAGFTDYTKHIASIGTCKITLQNYDNKFSLLNASSPLYGKMIPNLAVQVWVFTPYNFSGGVWSNYDAFEQFTGYIKAIRTKSGKNGELTTVIDCEDGIGLLKANDNFVLPIMQNINSNFLAAAIINGGMNGCSSQTALTFTSQPANGEVITIEQIPEVNPTAYFTNDVGCFITVSVAAGTSSITVNNGALLIKGQVVLISTGLFFVNAIVGHVITLSSIQFGTSVSGTWGIGTTAFTFGNPVSFKFVTALSGASNEVVIGASLSATLYNYLAANNQVRYWYDNSSVQHDTGGPGVGFASNINPLGLYVCNPYFQNTNGSISGTYLDTNGYPVFLGLLRDTAANALIYFNPYGTYFINHSLTAIAAIGLTQGVGAGTIAFLAQPYIPGTARNTYLVAGDTAKTKSKSPGQINNNGMTELEKVSIAEYGKLYYQPSFTALASQISGEDNKGFILKTLLDLYTYYNLPNTSFTNLGNTPIFDGISDRDKTITHSIATYYPRTLSSPGITLGQIASVESVPGKSGGERWAGVIKLPQGGAKTIRIEYTEPIAQRSIGGMNLITPLVPYTDFTINDKNDGKGFDYTNVNPPVCFFTVVNNGTSCDITVRNIALGTLYLTKLQIRGTAIYNFEQSAQQTQGPLILSGFNQPMVEDIELPMDGNVVAAYTQWMQTKYGTPQARMTEDIDFKNLVWTGDGSTFATPLFQAIQMMQPILISDPQSGFSNGRFLVLGYQKTIKAGGSTDMKVRVELLEPFNIFKLDDTSFGLLDNTTDLLGA